MTPTRKPLVAFVDDEKDLVASLKAEYSRDYDVLAFECPHEALQKIDETVAVVVADHRMPGMTGIDLLSKLRIKTPDTVRILLTAVADLLPLLTLVNEAKVFHCIPKDPLGSDNLRVVLADAVELYDLRRERRRNLITLERQNAQLKALVRVQTGEERSFEDLLGNDPHLQAAIRLARRAAKNVRPVLITGESGTGKEVLARAIHFESERNGPFKSENCALYLRDLAQATLFGKVRGAFTGSEEAQKGILREAEGGTVFLDEIGELNWDVQGYLLRFLDNGDIHPVGYSGKDNLRANNVRIIAATNRDLDAAVQNKHFRLDLFHRINGNTIRLPPLRDRLGDIPILAQHALIAESFKRGLSSFSMSLAAISYLRTLSYPGNVRELNNTIERATDAMEDDGKTIIELEHVRAVTQNGLSSPSRSGNLSVAVNEFKKDFIESALKRYDYNRDQAAAELGMSVKNLYLLIQKLRISTEK